ncbi:Protein of unknown function [Chryseobacterium ureilyticum]|uniref:DUF2971 domain-containing protein n=1 Tax=Chryseobacterium ureilyticum TaxID=373668 RepID=A0A1N7N036_9FLAO|nr:DUF2971 domain-containing protein [Chryseobacterium ureilyticum]SIS91710.1 Protein of unknown function [Chryseobacterium ureilyticum]
MKVYKYRSIEKDIFDRDIKTLKENSFYSSNYSALNDPFDIYFNEEISHSVDLLKILFPFAELDNFKKCLGEVLDFKEKIGIYCLSTDFLNEQLWAYYASSYSGYCIEYDLDILIDKEQNFDFQYKFKVDYKESVPTLGIEDMSNLSSSFIQKMFATKKSAWKHEKEVRLIFDKYGMKKFHPSAITGIYFGIKTPEIVKETFYKLFENNDVKFYEVFPSNFELDFKLIYETKRKLKYDINKFDFEILKHRLDLAHESYYVFYKSKKAESEIKEFISAFREAYFIKENNSLYIFDNREIKQLIDIYPKKNKEYIDYANSIITVCDNWQEAGIYNPCKDTEYYEILKNQ